MPLRSLQIVRIVKLYKPLTQIRRGNILSVLNEMQFTDRVRTEKCLYDLYRPRLGLDAIYGPKSVFTVCTNRTDRKAAFSDRISLSILDNPLRVRSSYRLQMAKNKVVDSRRQKL